MINLIGQSLGRYHILEQLGEGGMATVYKAYDTRLERDVAVKIIRKSAFSPEVLERMLKRFEREAKALSKLTHPNIVGVIDYGDYEGSPYLVMEYLPGGTLKHRLGKPIPWQEAARLLLPIARALQFAHGQGIIHRDVKPSNILITLSGEPMLTDFGIAKILENEETATLTGTGMGVGTPEYMAPEQWTGQVTPQSDIYSLGVVFYEMVTGRKPYIADTPAAILLKQATEPLPRPAQVVPGLPEAVEKVLLKTLARKPEDRYADMNAFAAALESLLARQRITFQPVAKPAAPRPRIDDSMATVEQNESRETRLQEATRDEVAQVGNLPYKPTVRDTTLSHTTVKKKRAWQPWALGLGGLALLACLVIVAVIMGGNLTTIFSHPTNSLTLTATPTLTFTPLSTNTPATTLTTTYTPSAAITSTVTSTPWLIPTSTLTFLAPPKNVSASVNYVNNYSLGGCNFYLEWDYTSDISVNFEITWIDSTGDERHRVDYVVKNHHYALYEPVTWYFHPSFGEGDNITIHVIAYTASTPRIYSKPVSISLTCSQ